MVRAEPQAAYRTATANSVRLIDHSTPENATTVTVALHSMSTNERVVAVNARTSSAMRSSGLVSTPSAVMQQIALWPRYPPNFRQATHSRQTSPDTPPQKESVGPQNPDPAKTPRSL